jgi:hypothetical protein
MRTDLQHRHWKDKTSSKKKITRSADTDKHYNTQRCQARTNRGQQQKQQVDNEVGQDNIVYIRWAAIVRVDSF